MKIRKQKLHRGFSLIEIMIVLVILAGALAIAWPNLQKPLGRVKLDEASQTLREAIDESRHRAMSQNQSVLIRLRKGAHEVQSGSIDSFAEQLAGDLSSAAAPLSTKQPQVWKLPSDVVVMNVESIEDVPVQDEFGLSGGVSRSSEISSRGDSSGSKAVNANQASAPTGIGLETDFDSGDQEWWVPMNAMGVGSNAKITLLDKSTKKTIHVSYSSTTGGLEISR